MTNPIPTFKSLVTDCLDGKRKVYMTRYRKRINDLALSRAKDEHFNWIQNFKGKSNQEVKRYLSKYFPLKWSNLNKVTDIAVKELFDLSKCQFCKFGAYAAIEQPNGPCAETDWEYASKKFSTTYSNNNFEDYAGKSYITFKPPPPPNGARKVSCIKRITNDKGETEWYSMCHSCATKKSYRDQFCLPHGWKFENLEKKEYISGETKIQGKSYLIKHSKLGKQIVSKRTGETLTYNFNGEKYDISIPEYKIWYRFLSRSLGSPIDTALVIGYLTYESTTKKNQLTLNVSGPASCSGLKIYIDETSDIQPIPHKFANISGHGCYLSLEGYAKCKAYVFDWTTEQREKITETARTFREYFNAQNLETSEGKETSYSIDYDLKDENDFPGLLGNPNKTLQNFGFEPYGKLPKVIDQDSKNNSLVRYRDSINNFHDAHEKKNPDRMNSKFPFYNNNYWHYGEYEDIWQQDRINLLKKTYKKIITDDTRFNVLTEEFNKKLQEVLKMDGAEFCEATNEFNDFKNKFKEIPKKRIQRPWGEWVWVYE